MPPRKPSTAKKADSAAAKRKTARKPKTKTMAASEGIAPATAISEPVKQFHGNTTVYNRELADEICERIACGETLRQVCRLKGIGDSTVRRWVLNDIDGFSARYTHARELCLDVWAEEIVEIGDDAANDWMSREQRNLPDDDPKKVAWQVNGEHVTRSRLRVDSRKWLLSKLRPDRYGDKLQVGGDPAGAAIQHKHDIAFVIVDPATN